MLQESLCSSCCFGQHVIDLEKSLEEATREGAALPAVVVGFPGAEALSARLLPPALAPPVAARSADAGGCTVWVRTFGYNLSHGTERFLCCTKFTPLPDSAEASPGDAAHSGQKAKQILSESAPTLPPAHQVGAED